MKLSSVKAKAPELLNREDEEAVSAEMTILLYNNALRTNFVVLAAIAIILFVFYQHELIAYLLVWSCCMAAAVGVRLWLIHSFRVNKPDPKELLLYKKRYLHATMAVALIWMVVVVTGVQMEEFQIRMFFTLLLVSLLGAAAPTLSASLAGIYIYILVPSVPVVLIMLMRGGFDSAIGVALVIYIIMMVKSGQYMYHTLLESITLRLNQQYLNNSLEQKVKDRTEELVKAKDEAEKANRAKSVFLANISHEIRTPMNVIINLSQLALMEEMAPKASEFIGNVNRAGNNLLGIINDILDFSKIESGSFRIDRQHFELFKLFEEIEEEFTPLAKQKGIGFGIKVQGDFKGEYIGDALRIRQILINIIDNGIKFTEQGEVVVEVEEKGVQDGEIILDIKVVDSGIGISDEQMEKLFKPFKQADESTTRKYGGSGLGLVISKQLAEMMGGSITVTSELHIGSEFCITLPLETSSTLIVEDNALQDERRDVMSKLPMLENARVLIVDDIPANQLILEMLLANNKIHSTLAGNGKEALDILQRQRFEMIFMDIQMPEMDGYEATQAIRREPQYAKLPIIAMTANAMPEDIQKCNEYGMDACIVKPIDIDSVNAILVKYLVK